MKTPEELNALKEEVETLNRKLTELTEEELSQVAGGGSKPDIVTCPNCGKLISLMRDPFRTGMQGTCTCGFTVGEKWL